MDRFVSHLKNRIIFSRWNSKIAWHTATHSQRTSNHKNEKHQIKKPECPAPSIQEFTEDSGRAKVRGPEQKITSGSKQNERIFEEEPGQPQATLKENLRKVAGSLHSFRDRWLKVTSDPTILSWLKGYKISFIDKPHQVSEPKERDWNNDEISNISEFVEDLLYKGAISPCKNLSNQLLSNIFLRPKPDGTNRLILNLKSLNNFILTNHFKLEDGRTVVRLMNKEVAIWLN